MLKRNVSALAIVAAIGLALVPAASAGIIKIENEKGCSSDANGLDTETGTVRGGVHCDNGDPFSLEAFLDGTIGLLVGNDKTPSWNLVNDTGAHLSSLSFYYSGALAKNADIDMQVGGKFFESCVSNDGVHVNADPNCGSNDKTVKPEDGGLLPVMLTWSGGLGLGIGDVFNLGTASFAHSGQDAGCFSGTATCAPNTDVPAPGIMGLLLLGLVGFGLRRR